MTVPRYSQTDGSAEAQSTLRLMEAEHRHGNNLQILSNLVRRSLRNAESEDVREALTSVSELIDTIGRLHNLSRSGMGDLAHVLRAMAEQWQRLCNGNIRVNVDAEDGITLDPSKQTVAVLIVQECVLNAIKHGFPNGRRGVITISAYTDGRETVTLEVEDDGIGDAASTARKDVGRSTASPHGTSLIRDLALSLGGRLKRGAANGGEGCRVSVAWPVEKRLYEK